MFDLNGLRGDMVISACLRYDLAPIPMTLEAQLRTTPETASDYQDGKIIKVNEIDFRIVKAEPAHNLGGGTQGNRAVSGVSLTAFPEGCYTVAKRRPVAVIHKNTSFASIYRACGATVGITGDFNVSRFACFKGDVPTFQLAQVLQEESAVMTWRQGKVHLIHLRDLFLQAPIDDISSEHSEDIKSGFLEADMIPVYLSVGPDGKFLSGGRRDPAQVVAYTPRKTVRELNFMGKVLVRRKVIAAQPSPAIRAGDIISFRGVPLAVMTAAHFMKNNTDGGGAEQYSRFWLGSLS